MTETAKATLLAELKRLGTIEKAARAYVRTKAGSEGRADATLELVDALAVTKKVKGGWKTSSL